VLNIENGLTVLINFIMNVKYISQFSGDNTLKYGAIPKCMLPQRKEEGPDHGK